MDSKDYENFKFRSWKKQGVTDFDAVKNEILEILANNIFVKENKFRYPIEQKNRLNKTNYIFNRIDLNDYFIDYFIDCYNLLIKIDIDRSNLWQSPKIRGQTNFLEQYMLENQKALTGITDLKKEIPENRNFINRLMEKLHTI